MMQKINGMMLKEDFVKILELVKTCGSVIQKEISISGIYSPAKRAGV